MPQPNPLSKPIEQMTREMLRKKKRQQLRQKIAAQKRFDRMTPKVTSPTSSNVNWAKVKQQMQVRPISSQKVWR